MALYLANKLPVEIRQVFQDRVIKMAQQLGLKDDDAPNWLMAMMDLESAGSFNPGIINKIGCVGLIQFCPDNPGGNTKTINGKVVSLSYLAGLSAIQQLDYVQDYLAEKIRQYGIPGSFVDLYLMIFLPAAVKFNNKEPIFISSNAYMDSVKRNNPLFVDSSGNITKDSIESVYRKKYAGLFQAAQEYAKEAVSSVKETVMPGGSNVSFGIAASAFIISAGFLLLLAFKYNSKNNT